MSDTAQRHDGGLGPVLRVDLLGPMQIRRADGDVVELPRKVRALFAYLLTRRGTTVPRQTLLGLFWADRSEAQARSSLRQALNVLRTALDDAADAVLVTTAESVSVAASGVETDLDRSERSLADGSIEAVLQSVDLLEGLALEEPAFEDWLAGERERVRTKILAGLTACAEADEASGRHDAAAAHVAMILRHAPFDEAAHRRMMRLHLARGQTDAALRQFEKCRTALREHLDVAPNQETIAVREEAKRLRARSRPRADDAAEERSHSAPCLVAFAVDPEHSAMLSAWLAGRGGILPGSDDPSMLAFDDASAALRAAFEARAHLRDLAGGTEAPVAFALHFGEDAEAGAAHGPRDRQRLHAILDRTPRGEIHVSTRFFQAVRRNSPYFFDALVDEDPRGVSEVYRVSRPMQRQPFVAVYENQAPRQAKRPCSLAVAPIRHMDVDGSGNGFWAEGLTEDLILELSRIPRLHVSSRTTLFAIKSHDAVEIGQELGVGYVLSGSFRKMGQAARLNFTLAETDRGGVVWSERFNADLDRIFDVIDDIVAKAAARIAGRIEQSEMEAARIKRPDNMTAYEYYLRGVWHHRMGGVTSAHSRKAVEWLRKAIAADPTFHRPRAMLACAWSDLPEFDEDRADRSVTMAYEADPTDPEANRILSWVKFAKGEYDLAIRIADRSVELAPHDAYLLGRCAALHIFNGDPETGLARLTRAMELDPFMPVYIVEERLSAYYAMDDHEKVVAAARVLNHQTRRSQYYTAASLVALDRLDAARRVMQAALRDDPDLSFAYLRGQELFRDKGVMDRLQERLRQAGMPD